MSASNLKPSQLNEYNVKNTTLLVTNIEQLKKDANYKPNITSNKNVDMFDTIKEIAKKLGDLNNIEEIHEEKYIEYQEKIDELTITITNLTQRISDLENN